MNWVIIWGWTKKIYGNGDWIKCLFIGFFRKKYKMGGRKDTFRTIFLPELKSFLNFFPKTWVGRGEKRAFIGFFMGFGGRKKFEKKLARGMVSDRLTVPSR